MGLIERAVVGLCRVLWCQHGVIFVILVANTVLRYATGAACSGPTRCPNCCSPGW
jgi:hypothetical protein